MAIYTIGYEGKTLEGFLEDLERHQIKTLIDVRQLPLSRKKGFSKNKLRDALESHSKGYLHLKSLGCPKDVRDAYKADGSWQKYTTLFKKHLESQSEALGELATLASDNNCALMCFEANAKQCHRLFVADRIKSDTGMDVVHIR